MRLRIVLFMSAFALLTTIFSACGDSPTAPSRTLTINPISVHMRAGDSQIFTAEGGNEYYEFSIDSFNMQQYFDIEKVSKNEARVTLANIPRFGDGARVRVLSGTSGRYTFAYADVYFKR